MDKILVTGGGALNGKIVLSGAKNACLTLMPLALLSDAPLCLKNVPKLADIEMMKRLLETLGTEITYLPGGCKTMMLKSPDITSHFACYDLVRKMRASILVLGPLLARIGRAEVSLPGGCAIGARPVDLHLRGFEQMGAKIELKNGYIHAKAPNGLKAAIIDFPFVSVGATENLLMAASMAKGTTVLKNAAKEPEIGDLIACLNGMGAKISGAGTDVLTIEGCTRLDGFTHNVISDRIELGTYMIVPAITGGEIELIGGRRFMIEALADVLEASGVEIFETLGGLKVRCPENMRLQANDIVTSAYPGFPTDLQAQMMAALCTANGISTINERIFENRFMHVPELMRMGAKISVYGGCATVEGIEKLRGAPVMATDLRASVSLILAGLGAQGETLVSRVYHLDRGYENVESKLSAIGANIKRITELKG